MGSRNGKPNLLPMGEIAPPGSGAVMRFMRLLDAAKKLAMTRDDKNAVLVWENQLRNTGVGELPAFLDENIVKLAAVLETYLPDFAKIEGTGGGFRVVPDDELLLATQRGTTPSVRKASRYLTVAEWREQAGEPPIFMLVAEEGKRTLYRAAGNRWTKLWETV